MESNPEPKPQPQPLKNHWAEESAVNGVARAQCACLSPSQGKPKWTELRLHSEPQDTACPGWEKLLERIEEAARDGREVFAPGRDVPPAEWAQVVELPPTIAKLKAVKHLILYGSSLIRIPPEIGEMSSLEEFTPYTSYRLHWYPYEITRCRQLKRSTVSTRALYGNYKKRPPFPLLPQWNDSHVPKTCSVCNAPVEGARPLQYWVSLRVATDVLPLLVHACSRECLSKIPTPPEGYIPKLHRGGLGQPQPPKR